MNQQSFDLPPPWLEELMSKHPKPIQTTCLECGEDAKGWLRCIGCELESRENHAPE